MLCYDDYRSHEFRAVAFKAKRKRARNRKHVPGPSTSGKLPSVNLPSCKTDLANRILSAILYLLAYPFKRRKKMDETQILKGRLIDLAKRAYQQNIYTYSNFLSLQNNPFSMISATISLIFTTNVLEATNYLKDRLSDSVPRKTLVIPDIFRLRW